MAATPVFLNTYNLAEAPPAEALQQQGEIPGVSPLLGHVGEVAHWSGLGAYHSGVEVHGIEFGFGYHDMEGVTGCYEVPPRMAPIGRFREALPMGTTTLTKAEVKQIVRDLGRTPEFHGTSYSLLEKNCNHFSDVLLQKLQTGHRVPAYVNRLANMGSSMSWMLPQKFQDLLSPGAAAQEQQQQQQSSNFVPFSGSGFSLGSMSSLSSLSSVSQSASAPPATTTTSSTAPRQASSGGDSAAERRRQMAAAAEARLRVYQVPSEGAGTSDAPSSAGGDARWAVRKAGSADLPEVVQLQRGSLAEAYGDFLTDVQLKPWMEPGGALEEYMAANLSNMAVAIFGEILCGFVVMDGDDAAKIDLLWVKEDQRQRGVGRILMEWAEAQVAASESTCVVLECFAKNVRALTFYAKLGYSIQAHLTDVDTKADKVVMTKSLA